MTTVILIVAAYLIGSIPVGVVVGRIAGFDPRAIGSGNIGMTNVARAGGARAAIPTFVGDILKGAIPVAIARSIDLSPAATASVGLAAFLGAIASVFLKFQGGKGVSAALGIWIVLSPIAMLFALAAFGITVAVSRIVSMASLAAAIVLPIAVGAMGLPLGYLVLAVVMAALIAVRHHQNISRLMAGTEPRFGARKAAA